MEEFMPILYNLFKKTEAEGTSPNSLSKANITLKPKPDSLKGKLRTNISHEHKCRNLQQNISKSKLKMYEENFT